MGLTPLEGLMMATRSGDLDPAILSYLAREEKLSPDQVEHLLNYQSGLLGIAGRKDMRELEHAAPADAPAALAIAMFGYRVRKYIGAYLAVLGRVDAVIFGGGIGEHSAPMRARICQDLDNLGITLDSAAQCRAGSRRALHQQRCVDDRAVGDPPQRGTVYRPRGCQLARGGVASRLVSPAFARDICAAEHRRRALPDGHLARLPHHFRLHGNRDATADGAGGVALPNQARRCLSARRPPMGHRNRYPVRGRRRFRHGPVARARPALAAFHGMGGTDHRDAIFIGGLRLLHRSDFPRPVHVRMGSAARQGASRGGLRRRLQRNGLRRLCRDGQRLDEYTDRLQARPPGSCQSISTRSPH